VLALAVIALPLALFLLAGRGAPRGALLAAGAAAVIGLAVAGRFSQEDYLELRYSSAAPDYPRTEQPAIELRQGAWIEVEPTVRRVAGAGLVDVWELAGPLDPATCNAIAPPGELPAGPPFLPLPPATD
jgi:hypothetical protein